ncbi:MAG: hypothetical protein ACK46X_15640 [Candidatus Sericytochromatia bacterium]|jgi:hypothetical protein
MDYFFWDEILGRPSLMDDPFEDQPPEDVPVLPADATTVIITVRENADHW